MTRSVAALIMLLQFGSLCVGHAQTAVRPPEPVDAINAIVAAARTHDLVTLTDPHGNVQVQAFLLSLIRDPRLSEAVNDIVIEAASARYQDVVDRFVRGEEVPITALRKAWEDHTVANSLGDNAAELIRTVREVNASLPDARKLRVIGGDPPIDWDNVTSPKEHRHWIELRDSYPADLIRRQVLDRGRHALVIYGQGHLQRRQMASNYDMSTWQSQTVVSLVERDAAVRIFNIWTLLENNQELPDSFASWRAPSLAVLRDTSLGRLDFATYSRGLGGRFAVQSGTLTPVPKTEWRELHMEDQFDALLYLGPPSLMTSTGWSTARCEDADFVRERVRRLTIAGPPIELQKFKTSCGIQ